jgi:hypothetical protein
LAGGLVHKLSEYVEMAALEYWQDTGKEVLDSLWLAEYFQDGGVMDDYPGQNLVDFYALVQKALTIRIEKAEKLARLQQGKSDRSTKR